jgi:hypothetical protein
MVLLAGCAQDDGSTDKNGDKDVVTGPVELDADKENTHLSSADEGVDAYWMRSGWFYWNDVEPVQGEIDWEYSDSFITEDLKKAECLLVVIFPFANWDQDDCHQGEEYYTDFGVGKGGSVMVGAPCNMETYKSYLSSLVERYDGDGTDDMPGLKAPVKYWEIMNEPSMQGQSTGGMGEELKFFVGTTEEYVEILKASYEVIKEADPEAKVLHAGIAGMDQAFQDFWAPIYATENISDYFDIANLHTISTYSDREDLFMDKYLTFLGKYGLEDKPIWITELQLGSLLGGPDELENFDSLLVRTSVFSMALGADKLFHVSNWVKDKGKENGNGATSSTNLAYETLVSYMNSFDSIEIINQTYIRNEGDYAGLTSVIGHYKVTTSGSNVFYVLWGDSEIPAEISGTLKVTDIYGTSRTIGAAELVLGDEPVYVELL